MKSINPLDLNRILLSKQETIQLIDVREDYEREICKLENDLQICLNEIPEKKDLISKNQKVVIYCRSGVRSARAIEFLESHYSFDNLYNLDGGILAWADEIDQMIEKY